MIPYGITRPLWVKDNEIGSDNTCLCLNIPNGPIPKGTWGPSNWEVKSSSSKLYGFGFGFNSYYNDSLEFCSRDIQILGQWLLLFKWKQNELSAKFIFRVHYCLIKSTTGAHFTKSLWAHNWNLVKYVCSNFYSNNLIMPQCCTCQDSWAVMACAKLWHDMIIVLYAGATTCFLQDFGNEFINPQQQYKDRCSPCVTPCTVGQRNMVSAWL